MELKTANEKKYIQPRSWLLARSRPQGRSVKCSFSPVDQTLSLRCRLFQRIGLLVEAKPAWVGDCTWSPVDPGCVKTSFKSEFAPILVDFRKLQFAKALISLMLKF
jgi:hypothetical protein